MRRTLSASSILVLSLSVASSYIWSQIRTRVDLVVVPVSVKDSSGKLVAGLTRDDFTVLEDGVAQKISNFAADTQPLSAAIVIDDGMDARALQRLFPKFGAPLTIALTSGFAADDEMIAFRYDRSVFQLSDFSSDPAFIQDSLKGIAAIAALQPPERGDLLGDRRPGWLQSIFAVLQFGHKPERRGRVIHNAIYDAAMALQGRSPDRRKMIFIVSDGQAGGENAHRTEQNIELLLKNDIQVYGVSPQAPAFGSFKTLSAYARATGGDVYAGTTANSMETAFSRITDQARNQYVLGYVSTNRAERVQVFRNIVVKTRRPNQKVTHRKGYTQLPSP